MIERQEAVFPEGIAWGAVAGGSLVALAAYLVLAMLALGLGLGAVDVVTDPEAESGMITGAMGMWWTVSALLSLFLGGWVAGRIAGGPFAPRCLFLATLVWAAVTVVSFYLVTTSVSTLLGGPLAVATDSVYGVLSEARAQPEIVESTDDFEDEALAEARAREARRLAARAEGAMHAGMWAAFTLLLGGGAAVAGAWFATEPPAWARPARRWPAHPRS